MEPTPGQQLGHYRIDEKIGQGGMGSVYLATDVRLDRQVALKVLAEEVTSDPERRQRFRQEALLAAALNHPNIATVHDVGEADGTTFIVMEYLQGEPLRAAVRREPLSVERAVELATKIASGLERAHREGIVHRDLKPDNVVLTEEGVPKILDFGLSKLVGEDTAPARESDAPPVSELPTATALESPHVTRAGQILGTLAYMSPEQVQGRPADARTDVFSFGVLLYEMLVGERPFVGQSSLDTVSAILRDEPAPLGDARPDAPKQLERILDRCLAKKPGERFASGRELHEALSELRRQLTAPQVGAGVLLRRPGVLLGIGLLIALAVAGLVWIQQRAARVSWARNEALPEIERLFLAGDQDAALRLARDATQIIPDDPFLEEYLKNIAIPLDIDSDPSGATVYFKGYKHPDREWIPLGETPLENALVALPARFRVEKEGYLPYEGAPFDMRKTFRLFREEETPAGMVYVPRGSASFWGRSADLDAFWIDKFEVTNREFKEFVDDGGYATDGFWPDEVDRGAFVDTTGRPGPAGWSLGGHPEGADDLPVGGVSWHEANAYAAWAGKQLPTLFHWRQAAQQSVFSEILLWSNFDSGGPVAVGSSTGLGPNGTYDMAGNVREWVANPTGDLRYILGGAWSEPDYLYRGTDATDPMDRSLINGFRCIRTDEELPAETLVAIETTPFDHRQNEPVGDEVFSLIRQSFDFDPRPLDARIEASDEVPDSWRHELISVVPAYGEERLRIHLYLPTDSAPPYQAVVYFPPSSALYLRDGSRPSFPFGYFIPKSGRVLVYPIYQGTYERQSDRWGPNEERDLTIQIGKDLRRTVDYLESRDDIDANRLAYYGLSWGGSLGPIMTAIEPRFKASILLAGGSRSRPEGWPAVALPYNFAPRSTVPTVMINGRKDFGSPIETDIQPLFDLLGTPDADKRLVILDGGHVPAAPNDVIREVLGWLDLHLGPV